MPAVISECDQIWDLVAQIQLKTTSGQNLCALSCLNNISSLQLRTWCPWSLDALREIVGLDDSGASAPFVNNLVWCLWNLDSLGPEDPLRNCWT